MSRLQHTKVVHGKRQRHLAQAVLDLACLAGLAHLPLERPQLALDLAVDVLGTREVVVHALEPALGAYLSALVLGDARGLLYEHATLLRAARKNRVELALADDRVHLAPETRVVQDVDDVEQAARRVVYEVLGLPRAIDPSRYGDLGIIHGKHAVGVVEHERYLCHAHRLTGGGARKDNVLHGLATQVLWALLAQHPKNRVRDV